MDNNLDERQRILKMVEDGKVTASEAADLLGAMGQSKKTERPGRQPMNLGARWFRVRVTDLVTGKSKATVSIPMGLMDWGLKIGAQFAPEIGDLDLEELSDVLQSGADGKIIDVIDDEDGEHVEIFVE